MRQPALAVALGGGRRELGGQRAGDVEGFGVGLDQVGGHGGVGCGLTD
jgi:hypothetical protein